MTRCAGCRTFDAKAPVAGCLKSRVAAWGGIENLESGEQGDGTAASSDRRRVGGGHRGSGRHQSVRSERYRRHLCARRPGAYRAGDRSRQGRVPGVGAQHPAAALRSSGHRRRRDPQAQGGARRAAGARGGQAARRRHRRGGPRRPDLQVLRRRGAAPCRRAGALGAAGRRGRHLPRAARRRRPDHALELPLAIPAWKIAPALAYGNAVVLKPADLVPACAWAIADILQRAGAPRACSIW